MRSKLIGAIVLVAVLVVVLGAAGPAFAGSTIDAIIEDAQTGTIDGDWSAAEIQAAIAYIQNNPVLAQYSDLEGVLEDYLASLRAPGSIGADGSQLAFTGGEIFLFVGAGAGIAGAGALLRRRSRA